MRSNAFIFLIVLLILSLAGNWIQWKSAKEQSYSRFQENDRYQLEQSRKLGEIRARDSVISGLLSDRKADSTKYALEQRGLRTRINALRAKVTGPAVVQDTIIVFQDSLIASISVERDTLYIRDNVAFDSLQSNVDKLKGMFAEQWIRADRFQRDYDREKRKRFSLGIQAGYGFKGPDIQVGIQYTILRF